MAENGIGARSLRKEDARFLTGTGHYVDDISRPGQAYAAFVRSPHAHAKLNEVDTSKAAKAPGVIGVFTGDDLAADGIGGLICGWTVTDKNGDPMKAPPHPALAQGKVNYVGDHVAIVIADTLSEARDAAELVNVDYEVLTANVDTDAADADGTPQIHDDVPNNMSYDWELGDQAAVDEAISKAAHVTTLEIINNRLIPQCDRAAGRGRRI